MEIFKTLDKNYIKYGKVKINVIIDDNNEIWFNANNTAEALEYSDYKDAIKRHVDKNDTIQYINYNKQIYTLRQQSKSLYLNRKKRLKKGLNHC